MKKSAVAGLGICAVALAFAAKDPVIMTVNGVDVPKSEFEYLYNKNSQQQINPQTLDDYVEMFKLYKMKVADARAEGLDTLSSFIKETDQYRHDLAAPYLTDSVYINKLAEEAYQRSRKEVQANHIMFFKTRDADQNVILKNRADSLRKVLLNGADFAELARKYSEDRGSSSKGGSMGWIVANRFPYNFEEVAFSLPEGQISEVIESPAGYHILKGGKSRPARGSVHVSHILKLTQGKDEAGKAKARNEIDSLYSLVIKDPAAFAKLAEQNSEDPASARNGGLLPWFSTGEMVAEFDSVSFALKDGEISKPLETPYGYHIIYRHEGKGVAPYSEAKAGLIARVTNAQDPRSRMIRRHQTEKFAPKHKAKLNEKTLELMRRDLSKAGFDSLYLANWTTMPNGDMPLAVVDGKNTHAKEFMRKMVNQKEKNPVAASEIFNERLERFFNGLVMTAEEFSLAETEPDYRNLLKEYIDGSLLYEVSVRKVWDRAAQDTEGLEDYFNRNKANYKWTEPHVKGFLVQTVNDSVANLVRERASQLAADTLVNTIRKEFANNVAIDRVLLAQGSNALVDYLVFGGPEVNPSNSKYTVSFMINPRIINEPEEVNDVKGLVTSDYQNEFQEKWENELRKKYPVTVNEKVLRTVKPIK